MGCSYKPWGPSKRLLGGPLETSAPPNVFFADTVENLVENIWLRNGLGKPCFSPHSDPTTNENGDTLQTSPYYMATARNYFRSLVAKTDPGNRPGNGRTPRPTPWWHRGHHDSDTTAVTTLPFPTRNWTQGRGHHSRHHNGHHCGHHGGHHGSDTTSGHHGRTPPSTRRRNSQLESGPRTTDTTADTTMDTNVGTPR